jgi:predicted amidophosphoribosyltransferase
MRSRSATPTGRIARWLGAAAVHLLPARCFGCDAPLPRVQLIGACASCWATLAPVAPPLCAACGRPRIGADTRKRRICGPCRDAGGPLDEIVAAVVYQGFARRLLLRAKIGRRREVLPFLAGHLATALRTAGGPGPASVVVPVPSRPVARLLRGFDPAAELAAGVAERLGLRSRGDILRVTRAGWTPIKRLSGAARREAADRRIFARASAEGLHVILVDDVMTTGATAGAAAGALRRAGALSVVVAVWARTPREPL